MIVSCCAVNLDRLQEVSPLSAADAEVPLPPPCLFLESSGVEACDTPRYIQPLPVPPPVTNPNQFMSSNPEASSQTPTRYKTLNEYAEPVLLERHRRLAQAHAQPTNTNDESSRSYSRFDASLKEASSFIKPFYCAFSASSPSLQPRSDKAKLYPRITASAMGSSHNASTSVHSSSALLSRCFSVSSPSLAVAITDPPDETVIDPNAPDDPERIPSGLCQPTPLRVIPDLPDLTGKVAREGDYPAGRGGYADVWKCAMRLEMDECKARQCDPALRISGLRNYSTDTDSIYFR